VICTRRGGGHLPTSLIAQSLYWFAEDADLGWVADALVASRAQILDRWLEATAAQAFHAGRREHAVADHIPALFDALTALLRRSASRFVNPDAPLDDAAVLAAAGEHAAARVRQGLTPPDIVVEFRLLRQEIWHALRLRLPDKVPTTDVIAAELVVNDALDGAITMGLTALWNASKRSGKSCSPTPNLARISSSLEKIEDGAARMSAMLTTLLDSSRIVLGDLALAPVDADLRDVVREALDIVGPEAADRVTVEIRPGVETSGRWDAERLEHVFANLLSNAGKYSPPETPIRLTVDGDDAMLRVAFQDEGIGIAPQDLPRLFDRYTRGREAMAAGIEGFGLGLYLCRGIVEAHGGRIWAESDGPGTGTTIRLELPRAVAQPPAAEPSPRS